MFRPIAVAEMAESIGAGGGRDSAPTSEEVSGKERGSRAVTGKSAGDVRAKDSSVATVLGESTEEESSEL
jgi:hypothetical protein